MIDSFLTRLNALYLMSEELTDRVRTVARTTKHPKGSIILREGEICKDASMVANGLVRSYYINEGNDITSRLMDEGFIATSWISFYTQKPGNEFMEALED